MRAAGAYRTRVTFTGAKLQIESFPYQFDHVTIDNDKLRQAISLATEEYNEDVAEPTAAFNSAMKTAFDTFNAAIAFPRAHYDRKVAQAIALFGKA